MQIEELGELDALMLLPHLETLNLEFNPVTELPNYRFHVIHRCPHLRLLDSKVGAADSLVL